MQSLFLLIRLCCLLLLPCLIVTKPLSVYPEGSQVLNSTEFVPLLTNPPNLLNTTLLRGNSSGQSENEIWPIPGTTISLDVTSFPGVFMDKDDFDAAIGELKRTFRRKPQHEAVPHSFDSGTPRVRFQFVLQRPNVSWGDLAFVLTGLHNYVDDLERYWALEFKFSRIEGSPVIGSGFMTQRYSTGFE